MRTIAAALLGLAVAAVPRAAAAKEVAGVKLADTVSVGGQELRLNGAGIRKKFIIKVYVGALYLAAPSSDPAAIVATDAPKQVRMIFLRDVDRKSILGAFKEGFEANSPADAAEAKRQLDAIAKDIPDMKEKGELTVAYVPGEGTTLTTPGGTTAAVPGKPFADALFRNWLGPKPADKDLKQAMLGK
jgi:hypothetical protein